MVVDLAGKDNLWYHKKYNEESKDKLVNKIIGLVYCIYNKRMRFYFSKILFMPQIKYIIIDQICFITI